MKTERVVNDSWYVWVGWTVGCLTFVGVWAYSFSIIGFLGGVVVGWLPALIFGFIAGVIWPITLVALVAVIAGVFFQIL